MISAKLFIEGKLYRIYLLLIDGKSEVKDFFDEGRENSSARGQAAGFANLLTHLADAGTTDLTDRQFKSWRQSGVAGDSFSEDEGQADRRVRTCGETEASFRCGWVLGGLNHGESCGVEGGSRAQTFADFRRPPNTLPNHLPSTCLSRSTAR